MAPLEAGGLKIVSQASDSSLVLGPLCKNKPPFDNLKVRQALNYAIDRDEINDLIYQGTSEPIWAFWTQSSKLFNPKLKDYYAYNPKKAKKLLKEAGAENLTFDFYAGPTPETKRIGEILKEQMGRGRDHREPGELHEHRPGVLHRAEGAGGR